MGDFEGSNFSDVLDKIKAENLAEITDEKKIELLKGSTWLQSGTNKFASQKGQSGFGAVSFFFWLYFSTNISIQQPY